MTSFRLLPFETAPGPFNMAADETLLERAIAGQASLRFYEWDKPTVSLDYFQPATARVEQGLESLPFVRRPSGGGTLVHHHELTYCLATPLTEPWSSDEKWMPRMHRIIVRALEKLDVCQPSAEHVKGTHQRLAPALETLGLAGKPRPGEEQERHSAILCFQNFTPGDVLCAGRKIVGSAQRKQRQCLMQHGSILLAQSEHTPQLPGIKELTGKSLSARELAEALLAAFEAETGWSANATHWDAGEQASIQWFIENRYTAKAWNEKR